MVSAHWEAPEFTLLESARPGMLYDYGGFPPHTYELQYPAPGSTALADRIVALLTAAGIPAKTDAQRGFDHGVFIPLLVAFPDADIPVVPLSLKENLDPQEHIAVGRTLAPLRDEGVLIIGSGMSYHNMRAFRTPSATAPSTEFDASLSEALAKDDQAGRFDALNRWANLPAARNAHPREEHLLPLMIAAGAGDSDAGEHVFSDVVMKATISAFRFG